MGGLKNKIIELLLNMLSSIDTALNECLGFLSIDFVTNGGGGSIQQALHNATTGITTGIQVFLMPICITIVATCYMIELGKEATKLEAVRFETGIKVLMKLAIANAALKICSDVLMSIYIRATTLLQNTMTAHGGISHFKDDVEPILNIQLSGMGTWEFIGFAMTMLIVFLAVWIVVILVYVMAISRGIEIIMYIAFAPLAFAFIPLERSHITLKFVTAFTGVVLQGLVIFITIFIFNSMSTTILTGSGNAIELGANMLIVTLVMGMMVFKSGSFAKSILNA